MSKISIFNTLQKCCEFETREEKIQALRANGNPALYSVLKHMFDPNIKFLLPKGEPPYTPLEFDERGRLYVEARKFYLFIEGGHDTINQTKRESLFISLLENINKEEAQLVLAMKDKKSPIKGLTKNLVATAFPGYFQMSKQTKYHKSDMMKNKTKNYHGYMMEEEEISLKDIKRSKEQKHYRNYENALRSKDVTRLMSYEED